MNIRNYISILKKFRKSQKKFKSQNYSKEYSEINSKSFWNYFFQAVFTKNSNEFKLEFRLRCSNLNEKYIHVNEYILERVINENGFEIKFEKLFQKKCTFWMEQRG